ncbi:MAG TPA: hypothetical protein DCS33_02455 [Gammaproteobacteria bacterium]|jgi:hypothetical protein|nr:hypothetical protein [Gammaproteobacteria bacterium]
MHSKYRLQPLFNPKSLQSVEFPIIEEGQRQICYKLWAAVRMLPLQEGQAGYPKFSAKFLNFSGLRYTYALYESACMSDVEQTVDRNSEGEKSFLAKMLGGDYGLAITYWALYFVGAGLFAAFGSRAVDAERWGPYLIMVGAMMAYTVVLIIGVRAAYKGPQLWKVMSRTSSVFMIINILIGISTLGFIY